MRSEHSLPEWKPMTPDEVMCFGVGECLYINPAYNQ
jgi:hypothetical protein